MSESDRAAIVRACEVRGVARLRMFGSALTERFDPGRSDVDFLVDFAPGAVGRLRRYFGLRDDLAAILDRDVDLVMSDAVANPYFAKSVFESAQELYAA